MTSAQVVETSVIVNNNSSFQNYAKPDDHTQPTTDTAGFKTFSVILFSLKMEPYILVSLESLFANIYNRWFLMEGKVLRADGLVIKHHIS